MSSLTNRRFPSLRYFTARDHQFWHGTLGVIFLVFVFLYALFLQPPAAFPENALVTVPEGATLSDIALQLQREHVIRSPFWFRSAIILLRGEKAAMAGDYHFQRPINVLSVAWRIAYGDHKLTSIRVTFPEGTSTREMALLLDVKLPDFDMERFLKAATGLEGRLFPDTYFFLPSTAEEKLVEIMEANFESKLGKISEKVKSFGRPIEEILTMASILEEEARTEETRKIIAGILWRRLEIGMPLQVDAAFLYVNGKTTYELTEEDLRIDSPYNTYRYPGLPKGPITNPGLSSLEAAVDPVSTPYLYYLSDRAGNMYYGKTFEDHVRNKMVYLNKK